MFAYRWSTPSNCPLNPSEMVIFYGTGFGPVTPQLGTGALPTLTATPPRLPAHVKSISSGLG
jgi:uncharacterized protein (TIGR03437 family)